MGGLGRLHKLAGMHGEDCEIGEGSRDPLNTLVLRRRPTRLRRMAPCITVTLLLLLSGIVASTVIMGLRGERHLSESEKAEKLTGNSSSGVPQETSNISQHPSAMLTAVNSGDKEYLQWTDDLGMSYCHGGFNYSNGDLVVPKQGIYRVFLQITYSVSGNEKQELDTGIHNEVQLYSDSYKMYRRLLSAYDMLQRKQTQSKSVYTSGLFSLLANDRLRVKSSHPRFINLNDYETFFGAELLPQ